jgi:hypothetical protein
MMRWSCGSALVLVLVLACEASHGEDHVAQRENHVAQCSRWPLEKTKQLQNHHCMHGMWRPLLAVASSRHWWVLWCLSNSLACRLADGHSLRTGVPQRVAMQSLARPMTHQLPAKLHGS